MNGVWLPARRVTLSVLRSGMRVRCRIQNRPVTDARLRQRGQDWFICNNVEQGHDCSESLRYGYDYSWRIDSSDFNSFEDRCAAEEITGCSVLFPYCPKETP